MSDRGGVTTVSLLVVILVGTAVGAVIGLLLRGSIAHGVVLAVIAGLAATLVATLARNFLVSRKIGVGPDDVAVPTVILIYGLIASIAGSLAGLELARLLHEPFPVWTGALAGLFSSILMALLMIAYRSSE
jgi:hypothetical protein